jgi:hypothetical protein
MRRFTPIDTSTSVDEDIRALMDDIDASMVDFERRLEEGRIRQPRPDSEEKIPAPQAKFAPAPAAEPVVPASAAAAEPAKAPPTPPAAPASAGGLLAELEREAKEKVGDRAVKLAANSQALHGALDRAYRYLDAFCRHVNALVPAVDRVYRFDNRCVFAGLRWQDANVKSRKNGLSEFALLDFVAFRVRLAAPNPVSVSVAWNRLDAFKKEMHVLDLRTAEGMDLDGVLEKDERIIRLAADFPVQITFGANYESGRIDILSRNLERFGIAAFVCNPEDVTQDFMDDLGRFLLARSNSLPTALQRAHCRAEL